MTTTQRVDKALRCSFCRKDQSVVAKLIAGPGVLICDECINLCNEILASELPGSAAQSPSRRTPTDWAQIAGLDDKPDDELIELLVAIHQSHGDVDQMARRVVEVLRSRNTSWTRIGEALHMTRQSAWERFSAED